MRTPCPVRHSDAAGVHDQAPAGEPHERHVRVPADHRRRGNTRQNLRPALRGRVHQHDLRVVPRSRVAEQHAVHRHRQRQRVQHRQVGRTQLLRRPREDRVRDERPRAAGRLGEFAVGVAAHPDRPVAERLQPVQGLHGHRAGQHVAEQHDLLRREHVRLRQDRLQRREHPVDVRQHRHLHRPTIGQAGRPGRGRSPRAQPAYAVVSGSSRTPVMFGLTWNFGGSPWIVRNAG